MMQVLTLIILLTVTVILPPLINGTDTFGAPLPNIQLHDLVL